MSDYYKVICEDCNVELVTPEELGKHWNKNHTIRAKGQISGKITKEMKEKYEFL